MSNGTIHQTKEPMGISHTINLKRRRPQQEDDSTTNLEHAKRVKFGRKGRVPSHAGILSETPERREELHMTNHKRKRSQQGEVEDSTTNLQDSKRVKFEERMSPHYTIR